MNPLHKAYSTLGLEPGSSLEEVQARYKRLVMVWHPERFSSEEGKRDAEVELGKIHSAIDLLIHHFESGEHNGDACECMLGTNATGGKAGDVADVAEKKENHREHYGGLAKRRAASKKPKAKSRLDLNELRDRRFDRLMQGNGEVGFDEDYEKPPKDVRNEKMLNWILIAVAAMLFLGWVSTTGPSSAPNQVPPPQTVQSTPGQTQQMNPLQQMMKSAGEQTEQPAQEQPQEAPQEQPQQSSQE